MAKTSASFTLMDYTDGISLLTGIDSNQPLTSLYDTSTQVLSPSWAVSPYLELTPRVVKAGTATDLVASMSQRKWYRRIAGASEWTEVISGQNGENINANDGVLVVSADKLIGDVWQIEYKFTGIYFDQILQLSFPVEVKVTFSRVANGTSFVVARAYTTGGDTFKNGQPASLPIKAELIRGTTHDITDLTYAWAKSTNGTTWTTISGATTDTLTVLPTDVDSFAMFRCTITDVDRTSETYNESFNTEGVSILDLSDPYQAVIESTAGNYFKNKIGSTILICRVYQSGTEIDTTGESMTYTWTKTDKNGAPVTGWTPTAVPVPTEEIVATNAKAISISHTDVDVKANFFCEVD